MLRCSSTRSRGHGCALLLESANQLTTVAAAVLFEDAYQSSLHDIEVAYQSSLHASMLAKLRTC